MTVQIDTTAVNNGVRLAQQTAHPSSPASGNELLYVISGANHGGMFLKDSSGRQIGPFITGSASSANVNTYGALYPFVKPVLGNFAWINQGSGTAVDNGYGGIDLYDNAVSTSTDYHILKLSTPGTPYTRTAALMINMVDINYMNFGIVWRESSSGKLDLLQVIYNNGSTTTPGLRRLNASSPTVDVADANIQLLYHVSPLIFLRLSDDGTNRKGWWSVDGRNFTLQFSTPRTNYITPDEIGIIFQARNATYDLAGSWLGWE